MATATFDKEIVIDDHAADIIIDVLNGPAPQKPLDNVIFRKDDEALAWLRLNSETLSTDLKK